MNYEEFFSFAYANTIHFLWMSFFICGFMFISLRKFSLGGALDPFHITYTFTYSTSYAVMTLLWLNGHIDNGLFFLLVFYGFCFISILIISNTYKVNLHRLSSMCDLLFGVKNADAIKIIFAIYVFLSFVIIYNKGFSLFTLTNRFEDNKGIGPLVKIWEYSVYFILSYFSIVSFNKKNSKIIVLLLILFAVFNSIVSGAKSDFFYYGLVFFFSRAIYTGKVQYNFKNLLSLLCVGLMSILVVLYFNFSLTLTTDFKIGDILESLLFRFYDRILSNGDAYYMGLPNNIIDAVSVDNVCITMLAPLIGISTLSSLVGYDVSSLDLGRQILLFHSPSLDVAGGPTDHFDLFAYKYFGAMGPIFVIFISVYIVVVKEIIKTGKDNVHLSSVYSVIWFSVLSAILKPGMIFSSLLIPALFFFLINVFIFLCRIK